MLAAPHTPPPRLPVIHWLTVGLLIGQIGATFAGEMARNATALAAVVILAVGLRWRGTVRPVVGAALLASAFGHWQVERVLRPTFPADHVSHAVGARVALHGHIVERPVRRPGKVRLVIEAEVMRRGPDWQPT